MERVVRHGRVAVLYHPDYGSGWYTGHYIEELLFDSNIIEWLEAKDYDKIKTYLTLKYPQVYLPSIAGLSIYWMPVGSEFRVDEYDGSESIVFKYDERWITA